MATNTTQTIKAMRPCELANLYGITTKTLKSWLDLYRDLIGERIGKYYTALQVRIIYSQFGVPNVQM